MSEDVKEIVETPEAPVEETQEQVEEKVEEIADDTPTLEDYERLKKEKETLAAQKEHWRKKAEEKKTPQALTNQLIDEESLLAKAREEAFLIQKGVTEEVLNEAKFRATAKGISLKEAMEDPVVVTLQKSIESRERRSKAQLAPSTGGASVNGVDLMNAVGMTEEEHRKAIGM